MHPKEELAKKLAITKRQLKNVKEKKPKHHPCLIYDEMILQSLIEDMTKELSA
jgi:hypothetical protein